PRDVAEKLKGNVKAVKPGESLDVAGIKFQTVPAYSTVEHRLQTHPKSNNWVGYILSLDGHRYWFSGDGDPNPDIEQVKTDGALGTFLARRRLSTDVYDGTGGSHGQQTRSRGGGDGGVIPHAGPAGGGLWRASGAQRGDPAGQGDHPGRVAQRGGALHDKLQLSWRGRQLRLDRAPAGGSREGRRGWRLDAPAALPGDASAARDPGFALRGGSHCPVGRGAAASQGPRPRYHGL